VFTIQSNSAEITSNPSQAKQPDREAGLPSGGGKVAVILVRNISGVPDPVVVLFPKRDEEDKGRS
jgi:hypothetical protein